VLAKFGSLEAIPASSGEWGIPGLRGADKLAVTLRTQMAEALLFRTIATVDESVRVGDVDSWRWSGPSAEFAEVAAELGAPALADRARRLATRS
jgi:hypothetical protein